MEHPPTGDESLHPRASLSSRRQVFLPRQSVVQATRNVHIVQGPCFRPRSKLSLLTFSPQSVKLDGYEVVETFLSRFPSACRTHIRSLFVSMRPQEVTQECDCAASQTDLLVTLLSTCTIIQSLTLYVYGSPQKHIVPPFTRLTHLTSLFIGTVAPEQLMPL
jgi:hypothetical protein